jgi:secreted trypsin-like serine protease
VRLLPALTVLALVLGVATADAKPPAQATASIVGGHTADIADWPSIAFLLAGWDADGDGRIESAAACTGTVIAPSWIVSAAHCAYRPDDRPIDAMVTLTGVADVNATGGQSIAADGLVVEPRWNPLTLTGDVLLIHLASRSSRPPMRVAVPGGRYVSWPGVPNAAGWGTIDEDSTIGTDVLQEAYFALRDNASCVTFAADFDRSTQTCAGTPRTAGACHGDSGGPLIVWDRTTGAPALWGLTSYGPQPDLGMRPCQLDAPAVYSWVPAFASFLRQALPAATPVKRAPLVIPPRDTTPPVLSHAKLGRKKLKRRRSTTLSFHLSEAAAVTVTVFTTRGRRYKALSPSTPLAASAGHARRRFASKVGGRALRRGHYKLRLDAVDTAGNRASPVTLRFRIVR